jgi:predicted NUDIX family NTP pyrophosphohydrolase
MKKQSAGLLLHKQMSGNIEVLLVHPGGPFWAKKDAGAWSIPKGEFELGEEPFEAAKREFAEEFGRPAPEGEFVSLGTAKQSSGKVVHAWAIESDFDASGIKSNTITIDWPPRSGKQMEIPEVDKAAWVSLAEAQVKIVKGQIPLLEALAGNLGQKIPDASMSDRVSDQTALF